MHKIIQPILNFLAFVAFTALITGVIIVFFPWLLFFNRKKASPIITNIVSKRLMYFTNRFLFRTRMTVIGKENIPPNTRRHAIISNHLSFFDISVFMYLLKSTFIMKKSVMYIFSYGLFAFTLGAIVIRRESLRDFQAVSVKMIEFIRAGLNIHIFPEGTRSRTGEPLPFKKGLIHKLYREKIPILCCAVWNTQSVMPCDNFSFANMNLQAPVYVSVGNLIDPGDYAKFDVFFNACVNEVSINLDAIKSKATPQITL